MSDTIDEINTRYDNYELDLREWYDRQFYELRLSRDAELKRIELPASFGINDIEIEEVVAGQWPHQRRHWG